MDARPFFLPLLLVLVLGGCSAAGPVAPSEPVTPSARPQDSAPLTVTPEHPQPGEPVTVTYHPRAEEARLQHPDTLELVYRSEQPDYRIVPMTKQGARWRARITPDTSARFLRFYVQSDSLQDRNGGVGWGRLLYDAAGRPRRGAHVAQADFLREQYEDASYRDSLLLEAYRRELAHHPDHLLARAHLHALLAEHDSVQAEALRQAVLADIDSVRARHAGDPQRLREVQRAYYALGRRDQAQSVGAALAERDPQGPEAELAAFRRATADGMDPGRAQQRADAFFERFSGSFFESGIYESLFEKYRDARQTEKMIRAGQQWIRTEQIHKARAHGQVAQALAGAGRYDAAVAQAKRAVEAADEAPQGYTFFKTKTGWDWAPTPLTPKARRQLARRQRGRQRGVLGHIYYRRQDYTKAAEVLAQAVEEHPSDPLLWAHLAQAYEKTGRPRRAYAAVEKALRRQPSLRPARSLFRRLYVQRHGSEEGLQAAVARLARGKLLRERLDQAAPPLKLATFGGDSLRTEALEDKVLVLDFWASWCSPCHEAFPHLQTVYEKYREAPDVKFLVVNTSWRDSKAQARRFIEKEGYTFPLYWDAGGRLAGALGVRSIPTTVLIGKGGRVQYRESGFGGSQHYVENLTMRIEVLRAMESRP